MANLQNSRTSFVPTAAAVQSLRHFTTEVLWLRGEPSLWPTHISKLHRSSHCAGTRMPYVRALRQPALESGSPEALVLSLARCYLRWFLAIATRRKHEVEGYSDHPVGVIDPSLRGASQLLTLTLSPTVRFRATALPDSRALAALHREAMRSAILANGVTTTVYCQPFALALAE